MTTPAFDQTRTRWSFAAPPRQRALCPGCQQMRALRLDGGIHKHKCEPPKPVKIQHPSKGHKGERRLRIEAAVQAGKDDKEIATSEGVTKERVNQIRQMWKREVGR